MFQTDIENGLVVASMSVILEGSIANFSEFEGSWHFASQKDKPRLPFKYSWKSDVIPHDLFNLVTFSTLEDQNSLKIKSSKSKKAKLFNNPIKNEHEVSNEIAETQDNEPVLAESANSDTSGNILNVSINSEENWKHNEADISQQRKIDRKHPLFGVWEGSFSTTVSDTEDLIPERFFFHSYIGFDSDELLSQLPYEPTFTYSHLGINDKSIRQFIASVSPKPSISNSFGPVSSDVQAAPHAVEVLPCIQSENNSSEINIVPSNDKGIENEENMMSPSNIVMVWGFGCNIIGRFSLVGVYDISSNKIVCEKKYMLAKGNKRFRRYTLEFIPPQSGGSDEGVEVVDGESRSARLRHPPSNYSSAHMYPLSVDHSVPKKKKILMSKNSLDERYEPRYQFDADSEDTEDYRSAFLDEDTGEIYEGRWFSGLRHGRGICLYNDGTMYEGQWLYNKESGKGQLLQGDREVIYDGDWFDGLMHGQGTYNYANGDVYTGDWKEGHRHGKGEYICKNGCRYIGDFKDNKRVGKGIFSWPDGSIYDGEWENDSRHGRGFLSLANGFKYDGFWANNHPEGRGTCVFPSGQEYQGGFKNGFREGRGSIKFSEGAEYEGRFKDDRIDGQGTLKVIGTVPGAVEGEIMIPIQIQADIKRIHMKAGFGEIVYH